MAWTQACRLTVLAMLLDELEWQEGAHIAWADPIPTVRVTHYARDDLYYVVQYGGGKFPRLNVYWDDLDKLTAQAVLFNLMSDADAA